MNDLKTADFDELETLISRSTDSELTAEERERLNEILRDDPAALDFASRAFFNEALLRDELRAEETGRMIGGDFPLTPPEPEIVPGRFHWKWAAAVAVGGVLGSHFWMKQEDPVVKIPKVTEEAPIATLVRSLDSRFVAHRGTSFGQGDYQLETGVAEFLFRNEVVLVVEAPAEFSIHSDMLVKLERGRIRATVPTEAIGFTIEAPKLDVVDLGTEFGLFVDDDQDAQVLVFTGEVEVHGDGQKVLATEGYAAEWKEGKPVQIPDMDERAFRTSRDITRGNWEKSKRAILADPQLWGYYDFLPTAGREGKLVNRAKPGEDGIVIGAQWVRGRWDDSGALLFEKNDDRVKIQLPKNLDKVTISTWIKSDYVSGIFSAILNSDGAYRNGAHHLQILREGGLRIGVSGEKGYSGKTRKHLIEPGKWTHVAFTYDNESGEAKYYVNGQLEKTFTFEAGKSLELGPSHIGQWEESPNSKRRRNFRGRIDELFLSLRTYSAEEIAEIANAGNPPTW